MAGWLVSKFFDTLNMPLPTTPPETAKKTYHLPVEEDGLKPAPSSVLKQYLHSLSVPCFSTLHNQEYYPLYLSLLIAVSLADEFRSRNFSIYAQWLGVLSILRILRPSRRTLYLMD
jgi:hypothetical protein